MKENTRFVRLVNPLVIVDFHTTEQQFVGSENVSTPTKAHTDDRTWLRTWDAIRPAARSCQT